MLFKAVTENRTDIVRFLIENGTTVLPGEHLLHVAVAIFQPSGGSASAWTRTRARRGATSE